MSSKFYSFCHQLVVCDVRNGYAVNFDYETSRFKIFVEDHLGSWSELSDMQDNLLAELNDFVSTCDKALKEQRALFVSLTSGSVKLLDEKITSKVQQRNYVEKFSHLKNTACNQIFTIIA